jgi:hypothetical protein
LSDSQKCQDKALDVALMVTVPLRQPSSFL